MPYTEQYHRDQITPLLNEVISKIKTLESFGWDGELNYAISYLVATTMRPEQGWRYHWLHRAYGVFGAAGAEFYRRLLGPYEDKAIEKNGDIQPYANP